ncbi:MAG: phenylacetate--CoA ligase family protein [Planctomycetota bacterium]|nr:phenylacetate--CoA ligase family protein [Planctomycetota bacterium]
MSQANRNLQSATRLEIEQHQLQRLNHLLAEILPANNFYHEKFGSHDLQLNDLSELVDLPFTTKHELISDNSESNSVVNLSYAADQYVRFHRTSGTTGSPLVILDTATDWQWWIDTWQYVLDAAGITEQDRAFLAFSFGPFIGFWSAHDAIVARGAMSIPGGGLRSLGRLELIESSGATLLFSTPTYALHLAEVAKNQGINLRNNNVSKIIVAGEPGGSTETIRARIEEAWGATLFDHAGASEIGPWGFASLDRTGIHVCEAEFIAEFINTETNLPAKTGELSELVLTTLGRSGCPVIRYRTGDRVIHEFQESNSFVHLAGGVLGRADDMLVIRGVNIFPAALDEIMRSFDDVIEYRITATRSGELDQLAIEVEDTTNDAQRIADKMETCLGLHVPVTCVAANSLPRSEGKSKRFIDLRESTT